MPIRRSGLIVRDEGILLPPVNDLDFQGAGVTVALSGSKLVATIPGGGGGGVDWAGLGIYRPQDYGSIDSTGATESTTAFQAALDALDASSKGGIFEAPAGTYIVTNLQSRGYSGGGSNRQTRILRGMGRGATILKAKSGTTAPILTVGTPSNQAVPICDIRDLAFNSNSQALTSMLRVNGLAWSKIENLWFDGTDAATMALYGYGLISSTIDNIYTQGPKRGIVLDFDGTYATNQMVIRDLEMSNHSLWALDFNYSGGLGFGSGANVLLEGRTTIEFGIGTASNASTGGINVGPGSLYQTGVLWFEALEAGTTAIKCVSQNAEFSHIYAGLGVGGSDPVLLNNSGTCVIRHLQGNNNKITNSGTLAFERVPSATVTGTAATTWHS